MAEQTHVVEAQERAERGTRACARLRRAGKVPAVLLVPNAESQPLVVEERALRRTVQTGAHMIRLRVGGQDRPVLLKHVQFDPLGERILHADFLEVRMDREITVDVEVVLKGKPVGVAEEGGVLVQYVRRLEVKCLPAAIPDRVEADVQTLRIGQTLRAGDIPLPQGVRMLHPETTVAGVEARVEAPEAAVPAPIEGAPAEPEVIRRERKTEESEEAAGQ
jgi:large subunit ribosomal protein L25